jgi:predicted Zn-dependent peptidase
MMQLSRLPNGLRVASRQMPGVETVTVGLFADVGSRHEAARENGLAHLFEHMVFKGAGGRSARQIAEAVEDVGGDLNAMTSRDATVFTARLIAGDLPLGLGIIADLVQRPHFDGAELAREKKVVLQELGEARDTPGDIVFDHLQQAAFPGQPLGASILGDERTVGGLGVGDLNAWRESHYHADNLVLIAAGKVDHDTLFSLGAAAFGGLPQGAVPVAAPARFGACDVVDARSSEQVHIAIGYPAPAVRAPDYFAARLFAEAIGGGMSSRLFQELREERGLAYSVYASLQAFDDAGLMSVYLATEPGDAPAALALVGEVLADAAASLTDAELERARALVKAGLLMSLESTEGQAAYLARQLWVHGRLVAPADVVAQINAVRLADVYAVAARILAERPARAFVGSGAEALAA